MKPLLLIFTRNPELGKVKTRLASAIGDHAALEVYTSLLEHTHEITNQLEVDKIVCYSEDLRADDLWEAKHYSKRLQEGADLGERMANAFRNGFADGYQRIIIIGSDLYDLSKNDLQGAFEQLLNHDYVIGPATDGGYYLLGMKRMNQHVFINKLWGTSSVFADTMHGVAPATVALLPLRNDIDVYQDLHGFPYFSKYFL